MDKKLLIRILCLAFALLNSILTFAGLNPIAVSNNVAYEIISISVTVVVMVLVPLVFNTPVVNVLDV